MSARHRKFLTLSFHDKLLLVQAWFMLGRYRAALLLTPFKRLTAHLTQRELPPESMPLPASQLELAKNIGYLVAVAARYTPWKSLCLVQVLVVQKLLARQAIPGYFCLGVQKGDVSVVASGGLSSHAWLQCGGSIVSGESGHEQYRVVSAFTWGAKTG